LVLIADAVQPLGVTWGNPANTVSTEQPLTGDGSTGSPVGITAGTAPSDAVLWEPTSASWVIANNPAIPTCTVDGTTGKGMYSTLTAAYAAGYRSFKIVGNTTEVTIPSNVSNDPLFFFIGSGTGAGVSLTFTDLNYTDDGPVSFASYESRGVTSATVNSLDITLTTFGINNASACFF